MKTILLLVHDDPGQESRLQAALDLCRAVGGHLVCLHVTALTPLFGSGHGVAGGAMLLELERENEVGHGARIKARLAAEDVSWEWRETTAYLGAALERASALADLIVVSGRLEGFAQPEMDALAGEIAISSGRPVLAVPEGARALPVAGNALVAWDGSDEAFDALAAALPLLRLAGSVTIVQIGACAVDGEEAAAYLSRHDIHPQLVRMEAGEPDGAADLLLARANCGRYAYLVMGGFHHHRLAEAVFGGVTRRLLKASEIPLLLAH